jgi:hypothetical protein
MRPRAAGTDKCLERSCTRCTFDATGCAADVIDRALRRILFRSDGSASLKFILQRAFRFTLGAGAVELSDLKQRA